MKWYAQVLVGACRVGGLDESTQTATCGITGIHRYVYIYVYVYLCMYTYSGMHVYEGVSGCMSRRKI